MNSNQFAEYLVQPFGEIVIATLDNSIAKRYLGTEKQPLEVLFPA